MNTKVIKIGPFVALLALLTLAGSSIGQQKLSPGEIIAKHLESIGRSDSITVAKKRMAVGSSAFSIRTASKKANGRVVMASDGSDLAFVSTFNMSDYQMERIGLFGNKINIPFIIPGRRSGLGTFLATYNKLMDDRIFGGCIFSTWPFLEQGGVRGKLETEGSKKVGDREAWVINYIPKGGLSGGSSIKLYFDAENFHHLRTVYRQKESENGFYDTGSKASNMGRAPDTWGGQLANNGSTLTEDFEDFRDENGLMLPHKYSIQLSADVASGTTDYKWSFVIEEYKLIKDFPADFFTFKERVG